MVLVFSAKPAFSNERCAGKYKNWEQVKAPVLRDKIESENYEVASDPHVFIDDRNNLQMVYTGGGEEGPAIKLATGKNWKNWEFSKTLLGYDKDHKKPRNRETPFYRYSKAAKHQIYFIGYDDEETYESEIYLGVSDYLKDGYKLVEYPVVKRGIIDNKKVEVITSPSIVEHEGQLYMTFLGWDNIKDTQNVWVFGAISDDDGYTWHSIKEVSTPVGMEGQVTKTPDGKYVALKTSEYKNHEAIYLSCADHPFGPYKMLEEPILKRQGRPWEVDENQAPQITFDPATGDAYVYYAGADYKKGWWVMMAIQKRDK